MIKVPLKQAILDKYYDKVSLFFNSELSYETAYNSLKNMRNAYILDHNSLVGASPYIHIVFPIGEASKFFDNSIKQIYEPVSSTLCKDNQFYFAEPELWLYLPDIEPPHEYEDSEGIRGGKVPARTLKLDDLEEKRQEYKKLVNKYFGVANAQIVGIQSPRKNGKSIFADYQYGPLKDISGVAIATIEDKETEKNRIFMNLNNLPNFVGKFEVKRPNLAPLFIRSVQINEKKGVVTIVWRNGDVTMAKCGPNDEFDPEKGIAIAFMKHWFNSTTQMNKWSREQTKDYYERTLENGFEDDERLPLKDLVQDFIKNA